MTAEVALALGNMPSTHPWYSYIGGSASLPGYISRAANKLVRMVVGGNAQNADLFPELRSSWTVGPTYPATPGWPGNAIPKPTDAIAITRITRAESGTLPDWSATQEKPLGEPVDPAQLGLMSKDSSVSGWAKIWARKGGRILVWPTPSAAYADYLHMYGLKSEVALVNPGDVLFMDAHWHDLVVTLTCYLIAQRLRWKEDAAMWLAQVEQELQQTMDVTAAQADIAYAMIEDAPTHLSVYGD